MSLKSLIEIEFVTDSNPSSNFFFEKTYVNYQVVQLLTYWVYGLETGKSYLVYVRYSLKCKNHTHFLYIHISKSLIFTPCSALKTFTKQYFFHPSF